MENKFTILGHCNTSIGIMLDSLASKLTDVEVAIINNISHEENRHQDMAYLHQDIKTTVHEMDTWSPTGNEEYILSGMSPKIKKSILDDFMGTYQLSLDDFRSVIHASAVITNGVHLGKGVNISPLSVIAQYAKLGKFVTINRNVSVGHHTTIGDFSSVNPGCNIGGNCKIGKNVVIGIGATVFDSITIGDNAVIGGGAVVTKDVAESTLVYGSPAKFVKDL